ncbi:MAG: 5'-methylthioadenosine/adenosylhomocysteine nucleosidase [Clostridia bacterium]|nr:5'-methylthioadenosine/adenosylhomocysteine nucleosidase [Clostridia bacterium]
MIGLIGAMRQEMDLLRKDMENQQVTEVGGDLFVTGKLYGQDCVMCVCGPGKVNAALAAQAMILTFHPEWILNLGVAGAGDRDVHILDMVIASATVQHDMDTAPFDPPGFVSKVGLIEFPTDEALRRRLLEAARAEGAQVHEGIIATGDQFVHTGEVKEKIHGLFHAMAIEMEGGAVCHACLTHGVPCGVIRTISDGADGDAQMDYPSFLREAAGQSQRVVARLLRGTET